MALVYNGRFAEFGRDLVPIIVKGTFIEVVEEDTDEAQGRQRSRSTPWCWTDRCSDADLISEASTVDVSVVCGDEQDVDESEFPASAATSPSRTSWWELTEEDSEQEVSATQEESCDPFSRGPGSKELEPAETRTTLMLRNLPEDYNREALINLLAREGFISAVDFLYLPSDLGSGRSFHYAFINLVSAADALRMQRHFEGFERWGVSATKAATVEWSSALQGRDALIDRYRNSPLMHASVMDELRPIILDGGRRTAFPSPTVALKAPRLRRVDKKVPGLR